MMRSLFSGISGLKSHQTRMDVVGNNIANINTIGFKGSRTTFSDMLSQMQSAASSPTDSRGGINPRQIGLGVNVASIDLLFSDASPQSTGKNTDLALSGDGGAFYLKSGEDSYFTRNGAFLFDEDGYYVMAGNGYRVQGWNGVNGVINTNSETTDIIVPVGRTMEAQETTQIDYSGNLDKESKMIKSITFTKSAGVTDEEAERVVTRSDPDDINSDITSVNVDGKNVLAATITYKDDTQITVTSGYYEVGKSVPITTLATIYDSLGGKHEVSILIDKDPNSSGTISEGTNVATPTDADALLTGRYTYTDDEGTTHILTRNTDADGNVTYTYVDNDGNTIEVSENEVSTSFDNRWRVYIAPGAGERGPADTSFANSYTRSVDTDNAESDGTSTTGTMNMVSYLYFNDKGSFVNNGTNENAAITFTYGDGNGAATNQAVFDFSTLTQYASATNSFPTTNGNAAGTLNSVAIDSRGVVMGTYTNGMIQEEAQIAVAKFSNASGLTKVSSTVYQQSNNSGTPNIRTIEAFGFSVISSALEMSNVDLATEFSEMIVTQRGFQANSKMTTVSDEMLETLIGMKR